MFRQPCVYIITNKKNGTLYVGVTSDLPKRIWEHKNKVVKGFSERYGLEKLVWYEVHGSMETAIVKEKTIKNWTRNHKIKKIEMMNPGWKDLFEEIL